MSGRSAYVRKEKTKAKEGKPGIIYARKVSGESNGQSVRDIPLPSVDEHAIDFGFNTAAFPAAPAASARSVVSSHSDEYGYARVKKPPTPVIDVSGIEKSSFRSMMDKKSEEVRKGLSSFSFGKKKKDLHANEQRPPTAATIRPSDEDFLDNADFNPQYSSRPSTQRDNVQNIRTGLPLGKFPPLPAPPQLKRWSGAGRPPQLWNKLRKDPELWDPQGDTLVYLSQQSPQAGGPPASFRVSSHVLQATESRFLISALRRGYMDRSDRYQVPSYPAHQGKMVSETSPQDSDGQISYELYFPAPPSVSKLDVSRYHVTTRNVFALLYQASFVGYNLFQALTDLQERLQVYMPSEVDSAGLIM